MKHVLYFTSHLRGPKAAAGARSWHQVKCLAETFTVTAVTPAVDPVSGKPVEPEHHEGLDQARVDVRLVRVAGVDRRRGLLHRALADFSTVLGQLRRGLASPRPDVVLAMSVPISQLLVAWFVAAVRRRPLVVDVRDMVFQTATEVGYLKQRRLARLLAGLEAWLLRRAVHVLTNSPRYRTFMIGDGVDASRITVAPIGYDDFGEPAEDTVGAWREKLAQEFGSEPPSFLAVYAGTLGQAFPVDALLDVARELGHRPDIGFVFVGDGQRLSEYRDRAVREGLRAVFPGRVSKSDVHAILRTVDCCLYPAGSGPYSAAILGNKVFDYLGAEQPIIYVGGRGAVSDVIDELGAGLVFGPEESRAAAAAIEGLADVPATRDRLGAGAAGYREAGYTARRSAEVLRERLVQVTTGPAALGDPGIDR